MWYIEPCSTDEHLQKVHLILTKGSVTCRVTKKLSKVCVPGDKNKMVTPSKAVFRDLLASKDHSSQAIKEAIDREVGM